jgi:SPP1 family predicted phage head-tail adaptor
VRAGQLRNEAKIQSNAPTRDASGGEVDAWADYVAAWWCELEQVSGGQVFRGQGVHGQATHVAIGRYESGVTSEMRVTLGARIFDILNAQNVRNRGRELRLELKERGV